MTPYGGLAFFCVLIVVLAPAVMLGLLGKSLRGYGLAVTVALLLAVFDSWTAKLTLLAFWLWETCLCCGYVRLRKRCGRLWILLVFLAASIAPLLVVKLGGLFPQMRVFSLLGISYMSFRAVQVLLDCYDGHLETVRLLDFSYFLLFAPSVSSGPLDRYRRFVKDLHSVPGREEYAVLLRGGVWKLAVGAFYNFCLGNLIWELWVAKLPESGFLPTVSYLYGYTLFMFFNFAGYSRMAVGTAYLLGIRMPDNFNRPFLAVDLKDFWARWHISLSAWLRDYVYTRFCMTALRKKWFKGKRTASYLGYLLTMTVMGIWHGFSLHFLVYGLYHGVLMGVNEALDTKWKRFKKLKKRPVPRIVMGVVTCHLFAFGLLLFSGRIL